MYKWLALLLPLAACLNSYGGPSEQGKQTSVPSPAPSTPAPSTPAPTTPDPSTPDPSTPPDLGSAPTAPTGTTTGGTGNGTGAGNGMGNGMGNGNGGTTGTTGGTTGTTGTTGSSTTASANCTALADCCQQLPPDFAMQCQSALQGASDTICQDILQNLEDQGVCP